MTATVPGLTVDAGELADVCRRYGVARLDVFGSVSRGEAGPDSDIDVLYELAPGSRLRWNIENPFLTGSRRSWSARRPPLPRCPSRAGLGEATSVRQVSPPVVVWAQLGVVWPLPGAHCFLEFLAATAEWMRVGLAARRSGGLRHVR